MNASSHALERPAAAESVSHGLPLALLAHALLLLALAFGVSWRSHDDEGVAEAELWAAVPQIAAPRAEPPPPEPEESKPEPRPEPKPDPELQRRAEREAQAQREAEIAERREKERKQKLLQQQQEEAERKKKQREAEKRRQDEADKKKQAQLDKQKADKAAKAEEAKREQLRQENLRRMQGLAGASGGPTSTGTALKSAGPSAGYAGRIKARIRPNITLTETPSGNPLAEVEVRTAPDGLILARRLVKPSGDAAWDAAVLRAIDKTERLPRDEDGRVPPVLIISFRPND